VTGTYAQVTEPFAETAMSPVIRAWTTLSAPRNFPVQSMSRRCVPAKVPVQVPSLHLAFLSDSQDSRSLSLPYGARWTSTCSVPLVSGS
jgi:hypothetical protein